MLYSYKTQYPKPLPNRIKFPNGTTKTDSSKFTEEDLISAGYIVVETPPTVEYPNKIDWNGNSWFIREPNIFEISKQKQYIQNECERKLFDTDYKVIKALETGNHIDPIYVQYRKELRDLYNSVDEIDIWNVAWPYPVKEDE
jgi:hypothetical protein